ncbi:hypothetical protein JDV02_007821 [Purpureocillium takamizusanense]|uniref:Transcription factor IIIC 90kDa subunit N-terminal domain-containing protein n=1 Tax=Purpureocillium takamizusanense TaxID=2060973 RepID=A0A9Q8VEJ0_9HYPO|nr:uncharacterized protein JDV02_007821 [Purpureocillium takamizusanense]UNI21872.1 hypothetical protein JDV02_007821 [Purpureocillium takamizusanense]
MMDRAKLRPLESLYFRFRPLAPHALSWSCDAELAVALDDSIHVFLPDFPANVGHDDPGSGKGSDVAHPQFSMALHAAALIQPDPSINARLCASAGVKILRARVGEDFKLQGVGGGPVTGAGAAVGQVVRVEWSPGGLGHSLRPVLAALTTSGCVLVLGEHIDTNSTINASATARTFRNWKVLWGLGAGLPIPDAQGGRDGVRYMKERIVSFSWAKEVSPGRALLAYVTHHREVVIMSVQYSGGSRRADAPGQEYAWRLSELARFDGSGPHRGMETGDADFVPSGTAFCLRWSPWYVATDSRTATLAYIARDHVGFRRITIRGDWEAGGDPAVDVEAADTTGICIPLGTDALVEWEDAIWPDGETWMARGIIATPFVPRPFQVDLCGSVNRIARHAVDECSSLYASEDEASTNPITGLVIHRPGPGEKPPAPRYSIVRLSATATNQDWYQTNVPEGEMPLPQWAERVRRLTLRTASRVAVMQGDYSDPESDDDDDDDDDDYEDDNEDMVAVVDGEEQVGNGEGEPPLSKVPPHRFRFWGLAASPGDGTTAALVTRHNTQHAHRRARSSIFFSWRDGRGSTSADGAGAASSRPAPPDGLTTEGRLWEAVYGGQGDVASILPPDGAEGPSAPLSTALHDLFRDVATRRGCVFCDAKLTTLGKEARCESGHTFGEVSPPSPLVSLSLSLPLREGHAFRAKQKC